MSRTRYPLILGSQSPRRRELLLGLGLEPLVRPADVDETVARGEEPDDYVARIAERKLEAVVESCRERGQSAACLVADTIVTIDGSVLGKPDSDARAVEMLLGLVGRTHRVLTAYRIEIAAQDVTETQKAGQTVVTEVTMRPASRSEVERYVATGEGRDKAGSYAAQGIGSFLLQGIRGSYSNVVGLPVSEVVTDLVRLGILEHFP